MARGSSWAATLEAISAVLPGKPGLTLAEVHTALGAWSLATVKRGLAELVHDKRIDFDDAERFRRYSRPV